ncbi:hypothetical protein [Archaeoglobus profundus]|uniref:Uncharacterized protein n=2 Tax=root TaxID=1 RepID=D2RFD7_ARCPA|nr:hypothetical protein [Archaeoglobus profundus]ADB58831.1 hypothetical protein Arcpr_1787 [Archaeoglobus profundus DSM 5631]
MSEEILGVSAVVILAILVTASWLTNSKLLKLTTLGFVFLYPVAIGQVAFPSGPDQLGNYISGVLKYWLAQVWEQIQNYIKQQLNLSL